MHPDTNASNRRRSKKKSQPKGDAARAPVLIAARRPGSPRLEKPSRRMKAASARPRTTDPTAPSAAEAELDLGEEVAPLEAAQPRKREARIVPRREDTVDEAEQLRRRLLAQLFQSEGQSAITRAADKYFQAGFELPVEQEAQLKLLEHFDEARVRSALQTLSGLLQTEEPRQLPLFRQRLRRLEDYADEPPTRTAAAELRRVLPA